MLTQKNENLLIFFRNKFIELTPLGDFVENDVIGSVFHYRIERDDSYGFYQKDKFYATLKEAVKAVFSKVRKHPNKAYNIYLRYFDKVINAKSTTMLFSFTMRENKIVIRFGYDRDFFCELNPEDQSIRYEPGDENEGNTIFANWLPKKINRTPNLIQQRIQSFQRFNIPSINFKGIVPAEHKETFLNEIEFTFTQMNLIFSLNNYFPVKEIFFSKYKNNYKGKYGAKPCAISLNPDYPHSIRSTIYHEFGHFLFDVGQFGYCPYRYSKHSADRTYAKELMLQILDILYEEETLSELNKKAEMRMKNSNNFAMKPDNDIEKYRTKREKYLLRSTEVFARLFETFLLKQDNEKGESLQYVLHFQQDELEKVKALFFQYLQVLQEDFLKEKATL